VVSGGYAVASISTAEIVLERNERYWAGPPAIRTVRLVLDIGGRSPIAEFEAGNLDYTEISTIDAPWVPYDSDLGPQLRRTPALSLTYLGFNTTAAPFNDVRVRQAIGAAVDWERVVGLGTFGGQEPAISMVPPGIPGAGDANWLPTHDPERARQLLAAAGFPGGAGLPTIHFATGQLPLAAGIAADLERELGMRVELEILDDHLERIVNDPPNIWVTGWIADYIGPNDFLGVLLESGSSNNYGRWSSAAFDAAIADALSSRDPAAAQAAYERALAEIQRDVPVVPLSGSTDWALSRDGLLGAGQNGLGIPRMAGMAWAP
jgi:ABC-type oligopeptide transport system substrate-binding subunit